MSARILLLVFAAVLLLSAGASAQSEYSFEEYSELESAIEEADILRLAAEPGMDEHRLAIERSLEARRHLLEYLTGWIAEGSLDPEMAAYARQARLVVVENLLHLYVDVGQCEEGERALTLIGSFEASEDEAFQAAFRAARDAVAECVPEDDSAGEVVVADPNPDSMQTGEPPGIEAPPRANGRRNAGIALASVGGSAFVAGWIWDLSLLDDRRAYIDARNACAESPPGPECSSSSGLDDSLRGARGPVIGLIAGGAVLGAVGVTLLLTDGDSETEPRSSWSMDLAPTGAQATLRWGGRR